MTHTHMERQPSCNVKSPPMWSVRRQLTSIVAAVVAWDPPTSVRNAAEEESHAILAPPSKDGDVMCFRFAVVQNEDRRLRK